MTAKTTHGNIDREKLLAIVSIFLFIFMMVFHLTHSALWGDEWVEYNYSQASIRNGDLYAKIISTFQPPLYNFIMHFWLKLGTSILWFRFFNVIIGCISGFFLYKTVVLLCDRKTAWFTLIALSVAYRWVYCIQECSEYALMLCGLFGAVYFYTVCSESFSYGRMILFLLFSVMAIYSQYGSVFVALPLLGLFFLREFFSRGSGLMKKIILLLSYAASFVFFAIPLLTFFVIKQMEHNQIGSNTVPITDGFWLDAPFKLGQIIGYFYHLNDSDVWLVVLGIFSIILITASVMVVARGKINWTRRSLIICLWITNAAHYFLVQKHIYAMIHPGKSAGFFGRYSYFYIPLLCVVLPVIFYETKKYALRGTEEPSERNDRSEYEEISGRKNAHPRFVSCCLITTIIFGMGISLFSTLQNWNKALDNQFADIWMAHEGWNDTTILYGEIARYGFDYYVSHAAGYQQGYLDKATDQVDNNHLPSSFWAWSSNWAGDGWQNTIDAANAQGYTVTIYYDSDDTGQLAYCTLN